MKIDLTYHYLTRHIVPGPQSFSYFVPLLLLPIALLIPRTKLSKWQSIGIFLPLMAVSTAHAWYVMDGTDVISADVLFQAAFFLAFQDPWAMYEYVTPRNPAVQKELAKQEDHPDPVEDEDTETTPFRPTADDGSPRNLAWPPGQAYPSSVAERSAWILNLLSCIRLNNWRIGHKAHDAAQPPPPGFPSRKAFFLRAIVSFTRGYLVLDITRAYISSDAYFITTNIPITSTLPFSTLSGFSARFLRSMVIGAQAWALISQVVYLAFLIPVGLNALGVLPDACSPHTWVPFFGSSRVIFVSGVRGFWGGYWHQTMRWMCSGPGYAVSDALRLRERGMARYACICVSAFALSGITHMGLVPPEPLHASVSANAIRLYVAAFFWVQPAAMMAEVLIIRLARGLLPVNFLLSRQAAVMRVVVNALWVLIWFGLCIPLLGEAGRQMGYWRVWPVPVSFWRGLRGEGWVAWPFLVA